MWKTISACSPVLAVLLSTAGGAQAVPAPARLDPDLTERLETTVPSLLERHAVPGAAIAVVSSDGVLYLGNFGVRDVADGEPVTPDTIFEAASLSKPLFAYRVLELVESGDLDLDRPLTEYLDEPWIEDPRLSEITARHVLAHATGFPNWRPERWGDDPQPLTVDFEPGSRFGYSGEGYMYLQAVVEEGGGRSLEEEMQATVFPDLGMESSTWVWRDELENRSAVGHDEEGAPARQGHPENPYAAGSLHTTAEDFGRFVARVLAELRSDETSLGTDMIEPITLVDRSLWWGLGWGLETRPGRRPVLWHWGDNEVWKALVFADPERDLGVVVLTNGANGLNVARPIVEAVLPGDHPALDFRMLNY